MHQNIIPLLLLLLLLLWVVVVLLLLLLLLLLWVSLFPDIFTRTPPKNIMRKKNGI